MRNCKIAVALAVLGMVSVAFGTAAPPPTHIDYTFMGGSTSVGSASWMYGVKTNVAVILDSFVIAQGVERDTGAAAGAATFYDPIVWTDSATHGLIINLPIGMNSAVTVPYALADSYGIQLPGRWNKWDVTKATADTNQTTRYYILGRPAAPITEMRVVR